MNTDAAPTVSYCEMVTTPRSCCSVALAGRPSEAWLCPFTPAGGAVSPQSRPRPRGCHAGDARSTPAGPPGACSLARRWRCVAAKSGRHLYFSDTLSAVRGKTMHGVYNFRRREIWIFGNFPSLPRFVAASGLSYTQQPTWVGLPVSDLHNSI